MREIHLTELHTFDDKELGRYPTEGDYDEIVREDCDIYGPDGTLLLAYRKGAISSLVNIDDERYSYWRWCSRQNPSIGRGNAAGRVIKEHRHRRIRKGERLFFEGASRGEFNDSSHEEILAFLDSRPEWDTQNFVVAEVKADKLYDVDFCKDKEKLIRVMKTKMSAAEAEELTTFLIENRNIWVRNWIRDVFIPSEDRQEVATFARKKYLGRETYNEVWSNVMGAFDRQALLAWCRLTHCTVKRYDEFKAEKPFFKQVDDLFKEHMPKERQFILDILGQLKDERYSLFGTAFTTITVNNNFQTALHRDGNNCKGGIAVLTSINKGTYDGYYFVFPEMRLGFRIDNGDFLCGDNQKFVHGHTPMTNLSDDAESVYFVFYTREKIKYAESWQCEQCRRSFMYWAGDNLKHLGTGRKTWNGIYPKMWKSPEWEQYKKDQGMEHCGSTTYCGN